MANSPLASLLAPGPPVNPNAPLTAATTGYAAPRLSPTAQAVTAVPKAATVTVPSVALAAAAKATPGPNLVGSYQKLGAQIRAKTAAGGAGGGQPPTRPPTTGMAGGTEPPGPSPHGIVAAAHTMLGTPYVWGGTTPGKALDCSAFMQAAYAKIGIQIPRTTYTQFAAGTPVSLRDIQPGDGVYVEPEGPGKPGHVGMYIGNGDVQESPHKGTVNQIVLLRDFLGDGLVGIRRFTNQGGR